LDSHFVFESVEQHELNNNFLNGFADLIVDYPSYESKAPEASPYTKYSMNRIWSKGSGDVFASPTLAVRHMSSS